MNIETIKFKIFFFKKNYQTLQNKFYRFFILLFSFSFFVDKRLFLSFYSGFFYDFNYDQMQKKKKEKVLHRQLFVGGWVMA
jgi:hypothetical protein